MIMAWGQGRSVWMTEPLFVAPPLVTDERADVCVVGAGIAGILTAEALRRAGLDVVVLDRGPVAGGETGRSTAHATSALDDRLYQLERIHGQRDAALAVQSHAAAVDHLESLAGELSLECGFRRLDGYLVVNPRHAGRGDELLRTELDACRRAGLADARLVDGLPRGWPRAWGRAARFPNQAQLDPVRLVCGVARHLRDRGVRVYTGSHVSAIHGGADAAVETRGGAKVRCRHVVVATNTPINDRVVVHTKQAGYQTYAVALRVARGAIEPALAWDGLWEDDESYRYVRLASPSDAAPDADDLLIVGGEDHKTGQDGHDYGRYTRLEAWAREHFPGLGAVEHRWSGEVMEPADGLAFIGRNPLDHPNVYIVTGDSGNGITHGAIASLIVPDLIAGRANPWADLYNPARKIGTGALREFARENLNTAAQYADWLRPGEVSDEREIPPGSGAVVNRGLRKIAVYRDDAGHCTRLSATCPHLGGVVRWNAQACTWDCPCHGSRFSTDGAVVHGPAKSDLAPLHDRPAAPGAEARPPGSAH